MADVYERARPGLSAGRARHASPSARARAGAHVVDLGAGHGQADARRSSSRGLRVTAIEPIARDARAPSSALPEAEVVRGDGRGDPARRRDGRRGDRRRRRSTGSTPTALAELHRVLRPRGGVALIWNVRDESHPLTSATPRSIRPLQGGDYPEMQGHATASRELAALRPASRSGVSARPAARRRRARRARSVRELHRGLPEDERAELLERVRALAPPGTFEFPYVTKVFTGHSR